jgi:endonuclease/exonuclease/phosphatase family metal-dependent hydrolase
MSALFPSLSTPIAAPRAGGAKAARRELKDIRQDAQSLLKAQPAVATSVQAVGAYDPQAWSLGQALQSLWQDFSHLFSGLFSTPSVPSTPSTPMQPTKGKTSFTVSSFNILGSNHTAPGGDAKGYASGVTRTGWAAQLIQQKHVDVVGFQEMANDQAREFKRVAGDVYGLFPGESRQSMASQNSIAWRKDEWDFVKGETVKVTSHKGNMWPVPIVRLKNKQTGQEALFLNFHNAPGYHIGKQQQNRDKATDQEVALINKLKRETGLPVIVTGDMNEKEHYAQRLNQEAGMHAASALPNGQLPKQVGIDWIFGSQNVHFKGFYRERGAFEKKISDHGMVASQVTIG